MAELTADALAAGILHHGALLVRGLADPEQAAELVAGIEEAFAACESAQRQGLDQNGPYFGRFEPVAPYTVGAARGWIWQAGGLWGVDSPRMLANLIEVMEQLGGGAGVDRLPGRAARRCR